MNMKLGNYVKKFDDIEREANANKGGKNVLTKDQAFIFKDVLSKYKTSNIGVLDASSGTGKTTCLMAIKKYCESHGISIQVCGSTGKAAHGIGGQTIHSFIKMSMVQNDNAETVEDALKLKSRDEDIEMPDIIVIDECSQVGKSLLREILSKNFNYILFVLDSQQLQPVKDKAVDWDSIADDKYTLTKTLRARDPRMLQMFDDFKKQKLGEMSNVKVEDYINGDNIVEIDYNDIAPLPANTEVCAVNYRNKITEHFVGKLKHPNHNIYNLNIGVSVTALQVVEDDSGELQQNQYGFAREFNNVHKYYNGQDVKINKLGEATQALVNYGYTTYGKWKLKLTKKGIMITNTEAPILRGEPESREDKFFISFPESDVLEECTLAVIDDNVFTLLWDNTEDIYNDMLEHYFQKLLPYLQRFRLIRAYYRDKTSVDISSLGYDIKKKLQELSRHYFMDWYEEHPDTYMRKAGWKNLLTAKAVVSARPSVSRSIVKAQGISINSVIITDVSFYGASDSAKYVAISRCKHGLIYIKNCPNVAKKDNNG